MVPHAVTDELDHERKSVGSVDGDGERFVANRASALIDRLTHGVCDLCVGDASEASLLRAANERDALIALCLLDVVRKTGHDEGHFSVFPHEKLVNTCQGDHLINRYVNFVDGDEQADTRAVQLFDELLHFQAPVGLRFIRVLPSDVHDLAYSQFS